MTVERAAHENHMLPKPAVITAVKQESQGAKTFTVRFKNPKEQKGFFFMPGKFMMVSVYGAGEMPISISSSPLRTGSLDLTVANVGNISSALFRLKKGSEIGLRGPYGKPFPIPRFRRKNVLFIAGGLGMAPLRSVVNAMLPKRGQFGKLRLFFGACSPSELIFPEDRKQWKKVPDFDLFLTVDKPSKDWCDHVGVVTTLFKDAKIPVENTVAVMCGPPVMIHFASLELEKLGMPAKDMYASMERIMHCGVGKCFHCNIGHKYACIDGPVFTVEEMRKFPKEA